MNKLKKEGFLNPLVLFVFIGGIILTLFLFNLTQKTITESQNEEIQHLLKRTTASIQRELNLDLQVLQSVKSFFNASENVRRDEFAEFVSQSLDKHKSIQALEWIPRITKETREQYELQAQKDLNVDFKIKNKSSDGKMVVSVVKDEYFPVYYVEPLVGNTKALGFDLASSAIRLKSLNEARNQRKIAATAKITLVQEKGKQFGFLVFVPVWEQKNRNELKGFALGVYRIGDMVKAALEHDKVNSSMLDMWLVDTTHKNKPELLFTNTNSDKVAVQEKSSTVELEGRVWTIYAKPNISFLEHTKSNLPLGVIVIGFLITLMLTYILSLKIQKNKTLEMLVTEKTLELTKTSQELEKLVDLFDQKIIASRTDPKGKIIYATTAFCNISGYSKEELMGRDHNIVRHPEMPKELYKELWHTIKKGKVFNCELKNKRKDGTFYWVDVVITPEFDEEGNIVSYFAIREDITAKKEVVEFNKTLYERVNEEVSKNQKKDQLLLHQSKLAAMGEMIGAIAHQWRQPLNTLAIQLQFIEDDFEDGLIDEAYLSKYSKESMKLVNFMSKTIDDFRNFFTVDKIKSNFDVKRKIEETTSMLSAQLEGHNIKLKVEGDRFIILGHASEFQQVILNIINNAKDALVEKKIEEGEIAIEIEAKDDKGYVRINDNAGGIPADVLDRIFEPYFTTKEQGKGTGLGLYMSKMIIDDNMNGVLSVKNSDKGAQFTIELEVVHE